MGEGKGQSKGIQHETLEGTVERITFYSPEDGYSVIRLTPSTPVGFWSGLGEDGTLTVVGNLPDLAPGEYLKLEGNWQTHPQYGQQFRALNVYRIAPATVEGLRRYLGSGLIKGIGPAIATRIVNYFGLDTLDILEHSPERLLEVDGVGQQRAGMIIRAWAEQRQVKDIMLFLQSHGVSTSLAVKIHKTYGDQALSIVQTDPYRLARDIYGIGFKTADQIARHLGLPPDHPSRLEAGLIYALHQASEDGHVYLPRDRLAETAATLLDVPPSELEPAISQAAESGSVKIEAPAGEEGEVQAVYLPPFYYAEVGIASRLRRIIETPHSRLGSSFDLNWPTLIDRAASETGIALSEQQKSAIHTALTHKVSTLTGGPGTGKTTTLRVLIGVLISQRHTFALASPTGRAAKRLSEATGQPARTIHRLLGYSPAQGFAYHEDYPLSVDMVIVDEVSMLDTVLANALFRAVDPASHLLLVGDVDQLPSVGAGDVLRDLIESGVMPVTRLDVIFRQSADSLIITNAHRINRGKMPLFSSEADDFFLFNVPDDPQRAADLVIDVVQNRIPRRFGLNPLDDVQVIVPMYRGPAGVASLNERLQATLNPPGRSAERVLGGRLYRVGDKVMQTVNNYDKEVFNGDIGRVHAFNLAEQTMTVAFDGRLVAYDWSEVPELTHAYAISVHRSQGSEYTAVVMPIIIQHYMLLQRNLLYTAVTRARKLVVLVGSKKAIAVAVRNDKVTQRYTALAERLRRGW
jgi:exodeoxyribonuclease V alpha subunit